MRGHEEIAGRANFTGVTFLDRIRAAGYNASSGSEVMAAQIGKNAVEVLAGGILHRKAMLLENLTDVGISTEDGKGTIIDFGFTSGQSNASNFIGVYPKDKQQGVYLTHGMEDPNPFTDLAMTLENMCKQTSYAVSIQSKALTYMTVTSFTMKEFGSNTDLPVRLFAPGSPRFNNNFAAIIGKAPFKPNTTYVVQFTGRISGGPASTGFDVSKNWSFTTGPKNFITCP